MTAVLRLATRSSPLALWQTQLVADVLLRNAAEQGRQLGIELVRVDTYGDRTQAASVPLHTIGGQGVFTKEVQRAVLDGAADVAIHSAKDLPTDTPDGLRIAAWPWRDDARDALVGAPLASLRVGAHVATGSVRRRAQLRGLRPDLRFSELRGNMHTRLEKAVGFDAIVVGAAALHRLGLAGRIAEVLEPDVLLPMVGQGAIAVECRADDAPTAACLAGIDDPAVRAEVECERAFLRELGAGCTLPVAAFAERDATRDELRLRTLVSSHDGTCGVAVDVRAPAIDALALGSRAGARALALGAARLLAAEPVA